MYGTVTRLQFQPEVDGFSVLQARNAVTPVPGLIFQYIVHLEATPNVFFLVAGFESKSDYQAYATQNEDEASTDNFRSLLEVDPDVNGGQLFDATRQ